MEERGRGGTRGGVGGIRGCSILWLNVLMRFGGGENVTV